MKVYYSHGDRISYDELAYIFSGGKITHTHTHTSLKDLPSSYLHFVCSFLLCLISFPPFMATPTDPYIAGHLHRLKDFLQHGVRQSNNSQQWQGWGEGFVSVWQGLMP